MRRAGAHGSMKIMHRAATVRELLRPSVRFTLPDGQGLDFWYFYGSFFYEKTNTPKVFRSRLERLDRGRRPRGSFGISSDERERRQLTKGESSGIGFHPT